MAKLNISAFLLFSLMVGIVAIQGVRGVKEYNARFNYISKRIKCNDCVNTSVLDSGSPSSELIKQEIKDMLAQNLSNQEIFDMVATENVNYMLYEPKFKITLNLIIISLFVIMLLLGFIVKVLYN